MLFTIDGLPRDLIPIKEFRAAHDLPPDFGVAFFDPKDWTSLGRIDRAGTALSGVRAVMLTAIPAQMLSRGWLAFVPGFAWLFEQQLYAINAQVGLKDVEIEFAVAGLSDVCQAMAYALVGDGVTRFQPVYTDWLDSTIKVFVEVYPYARRDETWNVKIFAHAYGRIGLVIRAGADTYYIYDPILACPAEGFMAALLGEVGARMIAATV